MRQWLRKLVQGVVLGALLALLFLYPQAAMQGVREGLSLWANAVLPALLPFFVLTSLLLESGMLRLLAPLAAPLCRLFRIPREAGGVLLSGWLSGAPNGARLAASLAKRGELTGPEASRLLSAATVTSPLFLVGTVGQALGSPALGGLIYGIHLLAAICNGVLWRGHGAHAARAAHAAPPPASAALLHVLPEALRTSCLSALFIGGAIAVFSALSSVLAALGAVEALQRTLLFLLPPEAVPPLLAGALEVSNGCRLAASCALSLPVRASMLCALCAFGGLSVFCQAQVFLDGLAPARTYLLGRLTHAGLSFALCRAIFLFFGSSLPTFAAQEAAAPLAPATPLAVPTLLLCLGFSLLPWRRLLRPR